MSITVVCGYIACLWSTLQSTTDRKKRGVNLQKIDAEYCRTARYCFLAREVKEGTKQKKTRTSPAPCVSVSSLRHHYEISVALIQYFEVHVEVFGEYILFCTMGIMPGGALHVSRPSGCLLSPEAIKVGLIEAYTSIYGNCLFMKLPERLVGAHALFEAYKVSMIHHISP